MYLFPGLEPAATGDTILQPVLAWNGLNAPAGWAMYSWNCCRNNNNLHSPAVSVSTGETLSGYAWGYTCNAATGVCGDWQVRISSTYYSSTLDTDSYGEVLNWAFGGALEAYNLNACNQYPADTAITYHNVSLNQVGGATMTPVWQTFITPGLTPNCVTGVQADGGTVSIQWCVPGTCSGRCGTVPDGCGGTLTCGGCAGNGRKCPDVNGDWFWSGLTALIT